ncbi:MAG: DUF6584 family protein [Hyphomicrobiaceae bacterium]
MTKYQEKTEEALSSGQLWRAKEILQGRLADAGYNCALFLEYGSVLRQMGDLRIAGKYLFLSGDRSPESNECITIFTDRDCKGPFSNFWKTMPTAAQNAPKPEIPQLVLDELAALGFHKSEINSTLDAISAELAERKRRRSEYYGSGKADWVGYAFIAIMLLLLLGLLYQAVVGLIALSRLILGWLAGFV